MDFSQIGVVTVVVAFASLILTAAAVNDITRKSSILRMLYPLGLALVAVVGVASTLYGDGLLAFRILIWAGASALGAMGALVGILA